MTVGIISHHQCLAHQMGEHHPEAPERLNAIQDQLIRSGLDYVVKQYQAKAIDKTRLYLAHDKDYVEYIFANAPSEGDFQIDADTSMCPATLNAALLSAGAAIDAVDLVMNKEISSAFCVTRPPGHHAEHDKAMGFCFFNNIALAAIYAKTHYKLKRVAIVDFDVHHGNGTEDIIKNRKGFLFCSTYQYPFYPFEIQASNKAPIINTPLDATTKSADFRQAILDDWLPALHKFKPEMIFISAGFDAHIEDEMSQLSLIDEDYRWVTEQLKQIADSYGHGRIVSVLEGGYALNALGRSAVAHINGLIGY
ncbi:Acetoin utilization deacetylase AcuC [Colwellia chukchiensis]|uniref:Acetoin utilization deacetylase AcuC n=1 Tax=Colwellia chukchiensis TaxID=641665 RepID=A0A1H7R3K6_9GAMM|nr:histone deacetylase family protein [Colwellia chukchiensis]SEL54866.1 Acetoin utilization deacetylase AcuC [Colwellia chukchiensis]